MDFNELLGRSLELERVAGWGWTQTFDHRSKKYLMWIGVGVNVCAHDDHTTRAQRVRQATSTRGRCVQESGSELGGFRR